MSKTLQTRVQMKHDTEANWNKATNFAPLAGEIIIYDTDASNPTQRMKIGNGIDILSNLPFVYENVGIYIGADAPADTSKLWIDTDDEGGEILATVATSGNYNDLINKPTIITSYNSLTDKPTIITMEQVRAEIDAAIASIAIYDGSVT